MALPGTGYGGSIGGPTNPQAFREESDAAQQTLRVLLGLRPVDTYEVIPFTQVGGRDTWKYTSTSSNPLLDHPTKVFRVGTGLVDIPDDAWRANYERMFNALPSDLQDRLRENKNLPSTERSPYLSALEDVMMATARFMVQLDFGVYQSTLESAVNSMLDNQALPNYALRMLVQGGNEMLAEIGTLLATLGPNDPSYDNLVNVLNQSQIFLNKLGTLAEALRQETDPAKIREKLSDLTQVLNDFTVEAQVLLSDTPFQMFNVLIGQMQTIAATASLGDASAWMLLALGPALTSLGNTPEARHALNALSGLLALSLDALLFEEPNPANSDLLEKIIGAAILITYTTALATTGALSSTEENEEPTLFLGVRQSFAFELSMILLLTTETPQTIFANLGAAIGASVDGQQVASAFLTTAFLFVIGTLLAPPGSTPLVTDEMKTTLQQNLTLLDQALAEAISHGSANGEKLGEIRASLGQALIALEKNDMETFWDQYAVALTVGGLDIETLRQNSNEIRNIAVIIQRALFPESGHLPPTTISTLA